MALRKFFFSFYKSRVHFEMVNQVIILVKKKMISVNGKHEFELNFVIFDVRTRVPISNFQRTFQIYYLLWNVFFS